MHPYISRALSPFFILFFFGFLRKIFQPDIHSVKIEITEFLHPGKILSVTVIINAKDRKTGLLCRLSRMKGIFKHKCFIRPAFKKLCCFQINQRIIFPCACFRTGKEPFSPACVSAIPEFLLLLVLKVPPVCKNPQQSSAHPRQSPVSASPADILFSDKQLPATDSSYVTFLQVPLWQ